MIKNFEMNAENIVIFLKVGLYVIWAFLFLHFNFSLKCFRWKKHAPDATQRHTNNQSGVYEKRRECEE